MPSRLRPDQPAQFVFGGDRRRPDAGPRHQREDRLAAHQALVGHHDLASALAIEVIIAGNAVHRRRRPGHDRDIVRVGEGRHHGIRRSEVTLPGKEPIVGKMPSGMPRSRYSGSHPSTQMTTVGRCGFRYPLPFSSIVSDIARLPSAARAYSLAPLAGEGWGEGRRGDRHPSSTYRASDGAAYERFLGRWSRLLAGPFAEFARPADQGRVLDVGCGTGSLALALAERGARDRVGRHRYRRSLYRVRAVAPRCRRHRFCASGMPAACPMPTALLRRLWRSFR